MPSPPRLTADELERACRRLCRRDPVIGAVVRRVGTYAIRRPRPPYDVLVRAVLYQQLAGAAARAIDRRFRAAFDGRYPRPEVLSRLSDARLRAFGLSRQKAAAVRAVARAFAGGAVSGRRLYRMDDDAVVESVTRIRGIGEWTAHMLLMQMGRPDVLAVGDYGLRKGAQLLYALDELPDRAAFEALAEPWRPYRSVASVYLWRAMDTVTPDGS